MGCLHTGDGYTFGEVATQLSGRAFGVPRNDGAPEDPSVVVHQPGEMLRNIKSTHVHIELNPSEWFTDLHGGSPPFFRGYMRL